MKHLLLAVIAFAASLAEAVSQDEHLREQGYPGSYSRVSAFSCFRPARVSR